jgi:hypothetical protein
MKVALAKDLRTLCHGAVLTGPINAVERVLPWH